MDQINEELKINRAKLARVSTFITNKINDQKYMKEWRCGTSDSPRWNFGFEGTLNQDEKELFQAMYVATGWSKVTVENSEENGLSPGMFCITLYK